MTDQTVTLNTVTLHTVTLHTGRQVAKPLIAVVQAHLIDLIERKPLPIVFIDTVMRARDPNHKLMPRVQTDLIELALLEPDGKMPDSICDIVVACVEGDGLGMCMRDPLI